MAGSLAEIRRLTNLEAHGINSVLDLFANATEAEGVITRDKFNLCFGRLLSNAQHSREDLMKCRKVLAILYDTFDTNGDGVVDFTELATGLSVLCGGSRDEKARAAFDLYDYNGDGVISLEEMTRYLTSVFKVMYESQPGTQERMGGASPEELAFVTAQQAFEDADANHDGVLTWEEFRAWYSASNGEDTDVVEQQQQQQPVTNLAEVRRLTNLAAHDIQDVLEVFAESTDVDGTVPRSAFVQCFSQIMYSADHSDADLDKCDVVLANLYDLFDTNGDGVVDYTELATGLSVLCAGSRDEKARAAFDLYDYNGDGVISLEEMTRYLTSVFKVMYESQPGTCEAMGGASPDELAIVTAQQAFTEADVDHDGVLSWEEFRSWYSASAGGGEEAAAAAPVALSAGSSLSEIRRLTNLENYDIHDVLEAFAEGVSEDGTVPRRHFNSVFAGFIQMANHGDEDLDMVYNVLHNLYTTFDTNGDGVVDFTELATGVSVLCGGSRDDKARAAFDLYDYNGDGVISLEEMTRYLMSVFKVMYSSQPGTQERMGGASPEELAVITAQQAFSDADADHDGVLTWEEFRAWYSSANAETSAPAAAEEPSVSLAEVRRLTNLQSHTIDDVLEMFAGFAEADGTVSLQSFSICFGELIRSAGHDDEDMQQASDVLGSLYDAFDSNGDGVVDFTELATGLSVLCGGSRDEKARAAFDLYDYNGDGVISLEEMTRYLTSVFKVMFRSQPGTQERVGGASAEELAIVTAQQAFTDADADHDGVLTWEEFQAWYSSTQPSTDAVSSGASSTPSWVSLAEIRRLTHLQDQRIADVLEMFAEYADEDGTISINAFQTCFAYLMEEALHSNEDMQKASIVLETLYDTFDTNGDGVVDFTELATGLSVLCGGSRDEKARAAFDLYDYNGDGVISLEEMTRYLTSVFKVMFQSQPGTQERVGGASPEELAFVTAQQAFEDADANHDGVLTWEEFQAWYSSTNAETSAPAAATSSASWVTLSEVRRLTHLQSANISDVLEMFAEFAGADGTISMDAFNTCFGELMYSAAHSNEDLQKASIVLETLYDTFDSNGDGVVDFTELATGLSVLCGGSRDEKARAAFDLYDYNGDGVISLEEMTRYLTSVFKVMFQSQPGTQERVGGAPAEELAFVTAQQAFADADADHDGVLTWEEFRAWYSVSNGEEAAPASSSTSTSLAEIRRLTNLQTANISDVLELFAELTDSNGTISVEAFSTLFGELIRDAGHDNEDMERASTVLANLYDTFDSNGDGVVDFTELATGLSVLCGGSRDEKARAAFDLYDYNGDGVISLEEMTRYLTSVFKVMYEAQPGTQEAMGGASPDELAIVTAQQAFTEADVDHDGVLSWEEFRSWYSASAGGGDEAAAAPVARGSSLPEIRRLTNLENYDIHDVLEAFAEGVSEDGTVPRRHFNRVFAGFVTSAGHGDEDLDLVSSVISNLYDVFDTNGDGVVDFTELATGVSVLCGGSRDDKARAAFDLYDYNGDGVISLEEMTRYLMSVFKVMYESQPGTQERMGGASPEELAVITAQQAFADADADHDGVLTWEEFRAWYSSANAETSAPAAAEEPSVSLAEVRRLTNLQSHSIDDVLEMFAEFAEADGTVSLQSFSICFGELIRSAGHDDEDMQSANSVLGGLYGVFDTNGDGVVDFTELATGLSVLCGGSRDEKARAAFDLYDYNGDGVISLEEMTRYLTSVFRVMYESQPGTQEAMGGASPDELAIVTAQQAFTDADADHDGVLTWEEFRSWYSSTGAGGDDSAPAAPAPQQTQSLAEIRYLTNLEAYPISDVLEWFAQASTDGYVSREAFSTVFNALIESADHDDVDFMKACAAVDSLYDVFDTNGDGVVDFTELATGLSVLCGGSRDDKARAAFDLYDYNGDGVISLEEMTRYLTSVFKVMYETQPGTQERVGGAPAEELAYVTAQQAFADADADHDGVLTWEEFRSWYSLSQ